VDAELFRVEKFHMERNKWKFSRSKNKTVIDVRKISARPNISSFSSKVVKQPTITAEEDEKKNKKLVDLCREGVMETVYNYSLKNSSSICSSINMPIDEVGNLPLHLTVSQNDYVFKD
jgi:hypothetical protein